MKAETVTLLQESNGPKHLAIYLTVLPDLPSNRKNCIA
jgi:hypothetical protein